MSEYRTDEETVELMQRWWSDNGLTLVVTLVLVFGGVFGWNWWQESRDAEVAAVSARYLEWLEAGEIDEVTPEAEALATALRASDPESPYVALIRFDAARRAVAAGDLAAARRELLAVLEVELPASFSDVARMRLARLDIAEGAADAALAHLDRVQGADDMPAVLELRGDAHRTAGDLDAARSAYDAAIAAAERGPTSPQPLLLMKRDDLALATDSPEIAE